MRGFWGLLRAYWLSDRWQEAWGLTAAIILSAESLFAALGGALVLGERLPPVGYAGAAIIFVSIILVEAVPAWRAQRITSSPGSA